MANWVGSTMVSFALTACFAGGGEAISHSARVPHECEIGSSCYQEAEYARSLQEVERHYDRGCTLGYSKSCLRMAHALREGQVSVLHHDVRIPRDAERAFTYFDRACSLKQLAGCAFAAEMISKEEVDGAVHAASLSYLEKACDVGEASENDFCSGPAEAKLAEGNEIRARDLFEKGCKASLKSPSCFGLGKLEEKAERWKSADDSYHRACFFAKIALSCAGEGRMQVKLGRAAVAGSRYAEACSLGDKESCEWVAAARAEREAQWKREEKERDAQWQRDEKEREAQWKREEKEREAQRRREEKENPSSKTSATGRESSQAQSLNMTDASADGLHA